MHESLLWFTAVYLNMKYEISEHDGFDNWISIMIDYYSFEYKIHNVEHDA